MFFRTGPVQDLRTAWSILHMDNVTLWLMRLNRGALLSRVRNTCFFPSARFHNVCLFSDYDELMQRLPIKKTSDLTACTTHTFKSINASCADMLFKRPKIFRTEHQHQITWCCTLWYWIKRQKGWKQIKSPWNKCATVTSVVQLNINVSSSKQFVYNLIYGEYQMDKIPVIRCPHSQFFHQ